MRKMMIAAALVLAVGAQAQKHNFKKMQYTWSMLYGMEFMDTIYVQEIKYADGTVQTTAATGGGSGTYTGASPATVSVGGVDVGDALTGTVSDILEQILVPYVAPVFSSFSISGQSTTVEVGTTLSTPVDFAWAFDDPGKITASTMDIYDVSGASYLATNISTTSPATSVNIGTIQKTNSGSHSWRGEATSTGSGLVQSSNYTVSWRWRDYAGWVSTTTPTNAQVIALDKAYSTNKAKDITTAAPTGSQYLAYYYPASFGVLTSIKVGGLQSIGAFTLSVVAVTNAAGGSTNYNFYISNNLLNASVAIEYE